MEIKIDKKAICAQCKKDKLHVDICRAKNAELRKLVEVEYSICGVCGKGYCSLRANPDNRLCEVCDNRIYNNVKEDGTLDKEVIFKEN